MTSQNVICNHTYVTERRRMHILDEYLEPRQCIANFKAHSRRSLSLLDKSVAKLAASCEAIRNEMHKRFMVLVWTWILLIKHNTTLLWSTKSVGINLCIWLKWVVREKVRNCSDRKFVRQTSEDCYSLEYKWCGNYGPDHSPRQSTDRSKNG